jgi:hypothetical protein
MAQTPLTSATPYCAGLQLFNYCDVRTVADYAQDLGQRPGGSPNPDPMVVAALPVVTELLLAASGDIEAAAMVSQRYTPTDLNALLTNGGAGAAKLRELCAGIMMQKLFERRPNRTAPEFPAVARAQAWLEALANGVRIFSFQEAADSGLPEVVVEQPPDHVAQNLTTTIARRFYGRRQRDFYQPPWG